MSIEDRLLDADEIDVNRDGLAVRVGEHVEGVVDHAPVMRGGIEERIERSVG